MTKPIERDDVPRFVQRSHPGSESAWPPQVVDVRPAQQEARTRPQTGDFGDRLEYGAKRISWVWTFGGAVVGCVVFGWAGHATYATWASKFVAVESLAPINAAFEKVESRLTSLEGRMHDKDLADAQLRKDFDEHKNTHPDTIGPKVQPRYRRLPGE